MFRFEKDKSCLMPIDLFEIEVDIPFIQQQEIKMKQIELPSFSDLFYQEAYSKVGLYYNDEGVGGQVIVDAPFSGAEYPEFTKGDAFELMISTKMAKNATSVSRFCHHFVIFPVEIGNTHAKEITHFRHDDTRPLCDPSQILVKTEFEKKQYSFTFFIPKIALYGFEDMSNEISFNYFVHSPKKGVQAFSASTENFIVSQMPSLWAIGKLKPNT